ncbi:MAG: hypothetical protein DME18_12770 [Verrucomicrobia bacterium]|nr:MAG: hypothetical protein DME18_12770 [Verrucomicrobiota bacterium]
MNKRSPSIRSLFQATHCVFVALIFLAGASSQAQVRMIAYVLPAGLPGDQDFSGSAGMDFEVVNSIVVTRLGVFDDSSDGLKRTITARLWNRGDPTGPAEVASLIFSPEDPGELIGGSRLKPLSAPIRLEVGFQGTIATENYGAEEQMYSSFGGAVGTVDDGNGLLAFVGRGRYGNAGEFPAAEQGEGTPLAYGAGTFEFETGTPGHPGPTTVRVILPSEDAATTLAWEAVTKPALAGSYRIFRAFAADGAFQQIAEVTELTYHDSGLQNDSPVFYRVRTVGTQGEDGVDSNTVSGTPHAGRPGVAYLNPTNQPGNQVIMGSSVGMDFDVVKPVRVRRLGVFDENSDGLKTPLHAGLYDRASRTELAGLDFTLEDPGELIDGSRFKTLPQALPLQAGFQGTIVAWGYGATELIVNMYFGSDANLGLYDGGSLLFVGTSRYGAQGQFPGTPDVAVNQYAAGTFYFEPEAERPQITISFTAGKVILTWPGEGTLESTPSLAEPWQPVLGAASGTAVIPPTDCQFYRVKR